VLFKGLFNIQYFDIKSPADTILKSSLWEPSQKLYINMKKQSKQTRLLTILPVLNYFYYHTLLNTLTVDLPSLGSTRSAGIGEYQWPTLCSWQKIAHFGDKSQRRNATAERFASWWWWWWHYHLKMC